MPSHGVKEFDASYIEYQEQYRNKVRESDRWLSERVAFSVKDKANPIVLDMGCSTGNFLLHLRKVLPNEPFLYGIDVVEDYIEACKHRYDLRGMMFETKDILAGPLFADYPGSLDVVIANMSMMFMNNPEYETAICHMADGLKPGGALFIMDYIHDFPHLIEVTERTETVPYSVTFRLRPQVLVERMCKSAGLAKPSFEEFYMPFELPVEGIKTHTKRLADGRNLSFRGALYQPWCLMKAIKSGH